MKISSNAPCPCHSGNKYKKCCQPYHAGSFPKNALLLMRSRYSAYALGLCDYIIKTTHPDNNDFTQDSQNWKNSIEDFCQTTQFLALTIHEFIDGETQAFVTFDATLSHGHLIEKSRFLKIGEQWMYESGAFS